MFRPLYELFVLYIYWNLQFLNNVIINQIKIIVPQVHVGPFAITCILFGFQSFDHERTCWSLFPKRVDIWFCFTCLFILYVDFVHDIIHYTIREVLTYKAISTPPRFIKVSVSSHESEQLCVRVLNVQSMPLYTVFFCKIFGTLSRTCFFLRFITLCIEHIHHRSVSQWLLLQFIFKYFLRKLLR